MAKRRRTRRGRVVFEGIAAPPDPSLFPVYEVSLGVFRNPPAEEKEEEVQTPKPGRRPRKRSRRGPVRD